MNAPTTFTFETTVERGRNEREYTVEAGYQIDADGKVTLTRWAIDDSTYPLTSRELEQLDAEAIEDAAQYLADWQEGIEAECASLEMAGRAQVRRAAA
jgi:hypothetical protein